MNVTWMQFYNQINGIYKTLPAQFVTRHSETRFNRIECKNVTHSKIETFRLLNLISLFSATFH